MQKRFAQMIEDMRRLIGGSASSRFLLAVSGGMDSMCMSDLFLQSLGPSSLAIAYCNFSLRGEESDGDEFLVREWAEKHGVEIFVKRFDTIGYAREKGISIEMAARDLRYGWFAELCQKHEFAALSVAHNANDNAETLILNLLRGTGLRGLSGMGAVSTISQIFVLRPLLKFTRKQIDGYVFTHKVPYRHDSSNFESDYKRNRIRNEVFPIFEKINPSFIRTLNREIGYFSAAADIVDDWCSSQLGSIVSTHPDNPSAVLIDIDNLLSTPHWSYLLYYILDSYNFGSQTLTSLEQLLESDRTISGKRFESPTHVLMTGRRKLTVYPIGDSYGLNSKLSDSSECILTVRGPGIYNFNGRKFIVENLLWEKGMSMRQPEGVLIMDADKMRFPFVCRRWLKGDWFVPLGMRGKKKVSDLFADLKYDALAKDLTVVLVDTRTEGLAEQQHVAGLLGVRIDDRYKVTSSTEKYIRLSLQ